MIPSLSRRVYLAIFLPLLLFVRVAQPQDKTASDPLPAWKPGPARNAILDFVRTVTDKAGPKYVRPEERIATFDNDGTLCIEQPLYPQFAFVLDRIKATASSPADWIKQVPFKALFSGDKEAISKFGKNEIDQLSLKAHVATTVDEFDTLAKDWLKATKHPRFHRPYTECVYQPMLEVLQYLRANGFKTYIVTGGDQAFVRAFSERVYGVPPEQVIGSSLKVAYGYREGRPVLTRLPLIATVDDKEGKPEAIELFIGRKPIAAFGNSDGDRQMLEWTQSGRGARLMMLVHHDDKEREYAYGAESPIGTFSDRLMAQATKQGWGVISMKNDWKRVFAIEEN